MLKAHITSAHNWSALWGQWCLQSGMGLEGGAILSYEWVMGNETVDLFEAVFGSY